MMPRIPDSLRALLNNLVDYAGLYPPAGLALPQVLENYAAYLGSAESWMLNRLVLPAAKLQEVRLGEAWRVTLLVEREPGALAPQVETLETKLPHGLSLPTYCEAALEDIRGGYAKVRTGGLTPDAIPPSEAIADFLMAAAARRMAFKATAGLHHPFRSARSLTYSADSPCATMHGFVNVFVAAAFAWRGAARSLLVDVLNDEDSAEFQFQEGELRWRKQPIATSEIEAARRDFAHSCGSCSFTEPIEVLRISA